MDEFVDGSKEQMTDQVSAPAITSPWTRLAFGGALVLCVTFVGPACRQAATPAPTPGPAATASQAQAAAPLDPEAVATIEPAPEATPLPAGLAPFAKPWKGDFDGMVKRRIIRVLAVQNPVLYAVDKGREVGITYEAIKAFEAEINRKLGKNTVKVHVFILPVPRDELLSRLEKGEGDIAAAALTITPEGKKRVSFSAPLATRRHRGSHHRSRHARAGRAR